VHQFPGWPPIHVNNHSLALFAEACGGSESLRLNVESPDAQEPMYRILPQPFAMVGRDPRADLLLSHPDVSQRHLYLQRIAGRIFCIDLESRTGIHWENGRQHTGWIDYEQTLRVGPYLIRPVLAEDGLPTPTSAQLDASAARFLEANSLPDVTLEFANKKKSPTWRMTPLLALVGRSQECRIHLEGRSVSSYHCGLVRTPLGVWIVDLFGRGGVWVNDIMVRCIRLDEGDRIKVGKFHIRVHYDSPPSRALRVSWKDVTARVDGSFSGPGALANDPTESQPAQARPTGDATSLVPEVIPNDLPVRDTLANERLLPVPIDLHLGQSGMNESVLVPIARQLSLMQQQMFDQFQQAMMMMFQMFNTLHRDQLSLIREEMEKLQDLTTEIHSLQAQLTERAQIQDVRPAPVSQHPPAAEEPAPPAPRPTPGIGPAKKPRPTPGFSEAPSPTFGGSAAAKARATVPPRLSDAEMHKWLNDRLAAIQEERQTHWKKILSFLTGSKGEGPAP
jgi:pSer/pThr/pTyr-binding forkhead associated (FHA) protein